MDKEKETKQQAAAGYPGVAIDEADDNRVNQPLVDERTKTLNNNPRNNDIDKGINKR